MAKKTITSTLFNIESTDTKNNSLWTDYNYIVEKKKYSTHKHEHSEISSVCVAVPNVDQFGAPSNIEKQFTILVETSSSDIIYSVHTNCTTIDHKCLIHKYNKSEILPTILPRSRIEKVSPSSYMELELSFVY